MWILRVLSIGFFNILLWPLHIPPWCTGYLFRDKVSSVTARRIGLGIVVAGMILCELICWWIPSSGRWVMFMVIAAFLDLLIGYAISFYQKHFRQHIKSDYQKEKFK